MSSVDEARSPSEQIVGRAGFTGYGYDKAGKPEAVHLMIGRRPYAALGNSNGDREMHECTGAGDGHAS